MEKRIYIVVVGDTTAKVETDNISINEITGQTTFFLGNVVSAVCPKEGFFYLLKYETLT